MRLSPSLRSALLLALVFILVGCDIRLNPTSLQTHIVPLPLNRSRVSFDDISYDAKLERVVVPGAETGALALIDPQTRIVELVQGFSAQTNSAEPLIGATSAVNVRGTLFALDRSAKMIYAVDPNSRQITSSTPVQDVPDYIRFVAASNELWVTERGLEQIEVFSLSNEQPPKASHASVIPVPNGPEALLIDRRSGLAFTNRPKNGTTAVIQVQTHNIIYEWGNGCSKARGMAIDEDRSFLFVACAEGKVVMMDILHNGVQITSQNYGSGLDFVAYNPRLKHLYLPSADSAIVAIFAVVDKPTPAHPANGATPTSASILGEDDNAATALPSATMSLIRLGTADTALKARCVTVDDQNNIWICDPEHGRMLMIPDTFPDSGL